MKAMGKKLFWTTMGFLAVSGTVLFVYREPVLTRGTAFVVNKAAHEYFDGDVRLKRVRLDRGLRLTVEGIEGSLITENGPYPFEAGQIRSEDPLYRVFSAKGAGFVFSGIRPRGSSRQGVEGHLQLRAGREWFSKFEIKIMDLGLEDVQWINPQNLKGATGRMEGGLVFGSDYREKLEFQMGLNVRQPGGYLQARFFDMLRPYIPGMPQISIAGQGADGVVAYRDARLELGIAASGTVKGFLHIYVPEYNINLNVNLEVRLDQENALMELFKTMGLLKIKA